MLNAKSILSLSIFVIFKLIYTVSTFSRTRQTCGWVKINKEKDRKVYPFRLNFPVFSFILTDFYLDRL